MQLPNNYPLARRRLEFLKKSLTKNMVKAKMYDEPIQE